MSRGRPGLPAKVPRADKQTCVAQDGTEQSVFPGLAQALRASEGWAGRIRFRPPGIDRLRALVPKSLLVFEIKLVSHQLEAEFAEDAFLKESEGFQRQPFFGAVQIPIEPFHLCPDRNQGLS